MSGRCWDIVPPTTQQNMTKTTVKIKSGREKPLIQWDTIGRKNMFGPFPTVFQDLLVQVDREACFVFPQNLFLLLQSLMVARFTPLHLTFGIVFGDVKASCSCSAVETHAMKLPVHSFCADVNARGGLELCSYWGSIALATFMHCVPQHLATPLCNFTGSATLWLSCCGS